MFCPILSLVSKKALALLMSFCWWHMNCSLLLKSELNHWSFHSTLALLMTQLTTRAYYKKLKSICIDGPVLNIFKDFQIVVNTCVFWLIGTSVNFNLWFLMFLKAVILILYFSSFILLICLNVANSLCRDLFKIQSWFST